VPILPIPWRMNKISLGLDPDDIIKSILALAFFGAGLFLTFLLGQISTLSCSRVEDADRCVLSVKWMGLASLKEIRIEGLTGAQVEESCDNDGCTYRVVLVTARQTLPLAAAYSSGKAGKSEIADQVNAFTRDRSIRTLNVKTGGGFWLIFPCIFLAVGIGMASKPLANAFRSIFGGRP
jgi:hypothetical protein